MTVNGATIASANYREGSTPSTIAADLAASASASLVYVSAVDDTLYLTSSTSGAASNYLYALNVTSSLFSPPSFSATPPSGNLDGGSDGNPGLTPQPIYNYSASYAAAGNLSSYTDSVMGAWGFSYDSLNRLVSSQNTGVTSTSTQYANNYGCWSYDSFGNRLSQSISTTPCTSNPPLMSWANYNASNQFTTTSQAPGGVPYDASGNVTYDGVNQYLYDGEGRICAVKSQPVSGTYTMTSYLYDANGTRVAKGSITAWSCDPTANGFQTINDYLLGPGGEQAAEMGMDPESGVLAWKHTNVYAAGTLIATYDGGNEINNELVAAGSSLSESSTAAARTYGLHFYFNDPLGTRRAQTDYAGVLEQTCASLPFGDGLNCVSATVGSNGQTYPGSITTPTEHHFTGKERDTESGNDYFGARYYASSMGRFMSPDPLNPVRSSPKVLMQFLEDPQDWNKYSYGLNNPVRYTDSTGNFTSKDHMAMEMTALRGLGYSDRAASRAAKADARMDNFHNMASGVPFLHHFVETSENPQHGEQSDHSDVVAAQKASEFFMADKELHAADLALAGEYGRSLDALGEASHTAQDIVRHQFEPAADHPLGEAPATDAETKAAVAATQQVEKDFETVLTTMGHERNMSDAQIKSVIDKVKAGPQ